MAPRSRWARKDDDGELIDIGDARRMYLECHGEGGPTVVLESGYPNDGTVWFAGGVLQGRRPLDRRFVRSPLRQHLP